MKVRSKLADIDFQFGEFEYKKDHLLIHSAVSQPMKTKVYVSPDDILSALGQMLRKPMVWLYLIGLPFFLLRYRRRHANKPKNN
jgi:hypothetical protein